MTPAEHAVVALLTALGEDPTRPGLLETPRRVASAFLNDLCSGYKIEPASFLEKTFPSDGYDGIVLVRDIPIISSCEHHLLPFTGICHCAYIPNGRIVGLSKFARVVDAFARRLQVQERLTHQIADCLEAALKPQGLLVTISAEHSCMVIRGVQKAGTKTVTSEIRGVFREDGSARTEVFQLLNQK